MSDSRITGKQIAIQLGIQIVGSLIAGIVLYQFFKPKDDPTTTGAKTASITKTSVTPVPEDELV